MQVTYGPGPSRHNALLSSRAQTVLSAAALTTFAVLIVIASLMNGSLP